MPNLDRLLSRADLRLPINVLLKQAAYVYGLSEIEHFELLRDGYEELNIKITTIKKDVYVVKIFSRGKIPENIHDYVKGLIEFSKAGIPVPKLLKANDTYLWETEGNHGMTYLCFMEFCEGKNFIKIKPSNKDLKTLTKYLAKIHDLHFQVKKNYDSWGAANLITEFERKKMYLEIRDLQSIQKTVDEFKEIDFSNFRWGIIHGALERANVLKNAQGGFCILDLGCLDYNALVIDLAIFMAHFCFGLKSVHETRNKCELIIKEYWKYHQMSQLELKSLPCLIRAVYAMFIINPLYLITALNDTSPQTRAWLKFGRDGLVRFANYEEFLI